MCFLCGLLRVCAFLCADSVSVPPLMASMDIGKKRPFRGDWALCVPGSHAKDVWKSPCDQVHAPVTSLEVTVCPPKGGQPCVCTQQQLVGNFCTRAEAEVARSGARYHAGTRVSWNGCSLHPFGLTPAHRPRRPQSSRHTPLGISPE